MDERDKAMLGHLKGCVEGAIDASRITDIANAIAGDVYLLDPWRFWFTLGLQLGQLTNELEGRPQP